MLRTDISSLSSVLETQRTTFKKQPYLELKERQQNLARLKQALLDNKEQLVAAMSEDFGHRSKDDSLIGDFVTTVGHLNYTVKNLDKWMRPESRHVALHMQPAKGEVHYQPKGVVGIIVPWNYPIFLSLGPLITALAAGNLAMLKMSEYTPKTAEVMADMLHKVFPSEEIAVFGGEADVAKAFSELPFDHLFFTGSTTVGRYVMQAAAKNLTPVTLELGGKSPAIIDAEIDIKTATTRFIQGKVLNAGQTCVAPDYLFCPANRVDELVSAVKKQFKSMYKTVNANDDYTSIVNDGQYQRLCKLLDDAEQKGATLVPLIDEQRDDSLRKIPLTLVLNVTDDMDIMQEEIFGPLLPVKTYEEHADVINYVNDRERPLALYVYSFDKQIQQLYIDNTHAGGMCINDAAFHVACDDMPFGGIGASGLGNYHGIEGFKTFSHAKSVLSRGKVSMSWALFPPYGKTLHKLLYKFLLR